MRPAALWVLFFLISFGLGYPTLNRYDPRETGGLTDTQTYYQLAVEGPAHADPENRYRLLVPTLAGGVARLVRGHTGTWEPVFLGFLVANSAFVATSSLLISLLGGAIAGGEAAGLLAAALYLLNFETANILLSGMVEAADGCFMLALVWCLLRKREWALPLWGALGAASKETFVPLASVFLLAWWWAAGREARSLGWVLGACTAAFAGITALQSAVNGHLFWPWEFAAGLHPQGGYARALLGNTFDRNVIFMAVWLFPLGFLRLRAMPRQWTAASAAAAVAAIAIATWHGSSAGAAARPLFSACGPLLSVSGALWLGRSEAHAS